MEQLKIGDRYKSPGGVNYQVALGNGENRCRMCYFNRPVLCQKPASAGPCRADERTDNHDIYFIKLEGRIQDLDGEEIIA